MTTPIFSDLNLARRIEGAEAAGGVEYAKAHARLFPDRGATSIAVAGGCATFAGVDSPSTQAFAQGLGDAVTAVEMQRLEDFYNARGAATNIEVCPLAHASLFDALYRRGYRPIEHSNVLVRRISLADGQADESGNDTVRVREARADEELTLAEIVTRGFVETIELPQMLVDLFRASFHAPGTHSFVAEIDGTVIAGGSLKINDNLALLAGASTLPEFRRRGAQTALLAYRLRFAAQHGCDLASVTTLPGSNSQRNAERNGFQVAYTRTKWLRAAS